MSQVYDEPIVVRLTQPVGPYPVGTEFGFKDVADAIRVLGSSAYFTVVRTQDGDPIPPPTPEDLTEAERQALARARAARLIRGSEFDKVVPGPGKIIRGTATGVEEVDASSIGGGGSFGGMRVIGLGDSNCIGAQNVQEHEWSHFSWYYAAVLQSGGKLVSLRNAGIWGDTTAGVLARLDADVIDHAPDLVLLNIGTNDTTFVYDHAATTANYHQIVTRLRQAGIRVVCCTLLPRNDSAGARERNARFNAWLWSYCARNAIDLVDVTSPLINPATGEFAAGMNRDSLHLSVEAATLVGKTIMDQLRDILPAATLPYARFIGDTTNIITNGVFVGDTDENGAANNWTYSTGSGGSATPSLVPDPAIVGNWQKLVVTEGGPQISQFISASGKFAPGDILRFSGRIKTQDVTGGLGTYVMADFGGGNRLAPMMASMANGDFTFTVARPVPETATGVTIRAYIGGAAASGTLQVAQLSLINETTVGGA